MSTKDMREQAGHMLSEAEVSLNGGEIEAFEKQVTDAKELMEKADKIDEAASQLKALKGDFNKPLNTIPVTSNDAALYNPDDQTAQMKASYKPQTWVKGLPAMAQPVWVQDQMGIREKELSLIHI